MRSPRWYDWVVGAGIWTLMSFGVAVGFDASGAPDEAVVSIFLGLSLGGLAAARIWWLRRAPALPAPEPREGITTGEMTAERLAEMEARIYELEERLELAERLLARAEQRPVLRAMPEETPR